MCVDKPTTLESIERDNGVSKVLFKGASFLLSAYPTVVIPGIIFLAIYFFKILHFFVNENSPRLSNLFWR